MTIRPANPLLRGAVPPRAETVRAPKTPDAPAGSRAQHAKAPADSPRPGAVADAHRVERPIPPAGQPCAQRGSMIDLLV